jgi:predicted PurR-regulated permease PerM
MDSRISQIAIAVFTFLGVTALLYVSKSIMIPFVLALIVWFLIRELRNLLARIKLGARAMPKWLLNLLAMAIIFVLAQLIIVMVSANVVEFQKVLPQYEKNITTSLNSIENYVGQDAIKWAQGKLTEIDFMQYAQEGINSITSIFGNVFLIIIYIMFLLLEERFFRDKIKAMYTTSEKFSAVNAIIKKINKSMGKYLSMKTLVSLMTGVLSFIALKIIGVDFAVFWAFLIFLLNFIPTVGSIIASIFPAVMALLQFADFTYFFIVLGVVGAIQVVIGNIIEPKLVGNSLNVSPIVVILSLAYWGTLWNVVGMMLCVPITVMLVIIFSQMESTRKMAILMSEKGKID